jgi:hypothetical protein
LGPRVREDDVLCLKMTQAFHVEHPNTRRNAAFPPGVPRKAPRHLADLELARGQSRSARADGQAAIILFVGYILENGRVVMEGAADELVANEDVKEFYLGVSGARRKSFRDMKFYRRRKRWLA